MKFFVPNEIYKDRIAICQDCVYYFKPTETKTPDDLPEEIIKEILDIWQYIKKGRAKNIEAKKRMIEMYNTIYNTNYSTTTNCGSCLSTCFDGIKKLYEKYND